jgi:Fic family protein
MKRIFAEYASHNEAYSAKMRFMTSGKRAAQAFKDAQAASRNRTYIWQSPDWPRLFCDMNTLLPVLTKARGVQGQLYGLLASLNLLDQADAQLEGWVNEAQSTALIEAQVLQLHSVRASVARRLGLSGTPNRQDTATEGMLDILESALAHSQQDRALTHTVLDSWHASLFPMGRSGIRSIAVGKYRSHVEAMQIVTPSLSGKDVVHFQAPPSSEVPTQMQELIAWFNKSGTAAWPTDGLVKAAIAHLWFETIHPYEDGNGRIGRALSELAIFQDWKVTCSDTNVRRFFSLSQQLWLDRKGYYEQLQLATGHEQLDITPWVRWFVGCITLAMEAAITHVAMAVEKNRFWQAVMLAQPNLNASQRKVLNKLYDTPEGFKNGLSTELYSSIASCSRATAYRDLTQLLAAGLLAQSGVGRGTRYRLVR